jgi:hypothetical protein
MNPLLTGIILFVAGMLGGALNAVAGGGGFIAFPALLFVGVPPIPANATNTISLWLGVNASARAYRKHLNISRRLLIPLLVVSVAGGLIGAFVLIRTPAHTFLRTIPWMMLGATLLFIFGKHLTRLLAISVSGEPSWGAIAGATAFEFLVALYGGYFGGGMGILTLAMLAAIGMTDINAMNALKAILGSVINGMATLTFLVAGVIYWPQGIVMTAGAIVGGYASAHYAQQLPQSWVRLVVILTALAMTIYFFFRAYL